MEDLIETPLANWIRTKRKEVNDWSFYPNPFPVEYLVIHHSLTKDGVNADWESIRKYHIEVNLWNDIGYHFGIEKVKDDYLIMLGRSIGVHGAHVKDGGFNSKSLGICIVGNWDIEEPPDKQWILSILFVDKLRDFLKSKGMIIKRENVIGHREAQQIAGLPPEKRKSCPGTKFNMDQFRSQLKEIEIV